MVQATTHQATTNLGWRLRRHPVAGQGLVSQIDDIVASGDQVMVVIHTPGIDRGRVRQAGDRNYLVLTVSGERIVRMRACRNRTWMTVAVAAGEVGRALRWDCVEAECVDPGPGRERAPLAVCSPLRFERMSPVPGFTSFRGQRNWPGWWWFYLHGRACGYESWLGRLLPRDQWQAQAARQAREPRLLVGGT